MKKRTDRWHRFCAGLLLAALLAGCSPAVRDEPVNGTDFPSLPDRLPQTSESEPTEAYRGLPGQDKERLSVALADPDRLNLNPFARGQGLFPIDPMGHLQPVYESLIRYDPRAMTYVPVLAESVHCLGSTVSIVLSQQARWHDGQPVTAGDLAFSIACHEDYRTEAGLALTERVGAIEILDSRQVNLRMKGDEPDSCQPCLEALSKMLVVPAHHWQALVGADGDPGSGRDAALPLIGSGPWAFHDDDGFALSLVRVPEQKGLVPGPTYLSIIRYAHPFLSREAFLHGDVDLLLDDLANPWPGREWEDADPDWMSLEGGERLSGITVNPYGNPVLGNRSVRRLLAGTAPLWGDLTISSTMSRLNQQRLSSAVEAAGLEAIGRLEAEAVLIRENGAFQLKWEEEDPPLVRLILPAGLNRAERTCQDFAREAKAIGLTVILDRVSQSEWERAYRSGHYELIYTETGMNESVTGLVSRLTAIPWLPQMAGRVEFDAASFFSALESLGEVSGTNGQIAALEDLAARVVEEGLFIPLSADSCQLGLWHPRQGMEIDWTTLLMADVRAVPFTDDSTAK